MLKIILLIIGVLFMVQNNIHSANEPKAQLLQVDKDFSKMSEEKGMAIAFDFYMADAAIMIKNNMAPVAGRNAINKLFQNASENEQLIWSPIFAEIAESKDLGYTIGEWTFSITDSTGAVEKSYGHYISIWKKQNDGNWKYVFDSGTSNGTTPHE